MKTINEIVEDLEGLDVTELLEIHNSYCEENSYHEDIFHVLDEEFFNLFHYDKPIDFARSILNGSVDLDDLYIRSDLHGHLYTYKRSEAFSEMDFYELAEFVCERPKLLETYIGE